MIKFEIHNRWSGDVKFTAEIECAEDAPIILKLSLAVKWALSHNAGLTDANLAGADLTRANLAGADLTRANLTDAGLTDANLAGADLIDANLAGADLIDANLAGADLTRANLTRANLTDADLTDANLIDANLAGADLAGANLIDADLTGANLTRANLTRANLTRTKNDFYAAISFAPAEVEGLRLALIEGRVDGSQYQGDCACLVGTIANIRDCDYRNISGLVPDSSRPSERFFLAIRKGDTPENSQPCKIVVEWIDEWLSNMKAAFGPKPGVEQCR